MKYLNLKQMTIAAMLGTSLLLTGCGGGGGGSVAPINDHPPPANPVDPTLGTYLEGVDLSEGSKESDSVVNGYFTTAQDSFSFAATTLTAIPGGINASDFSNALQAGGVSESDADDLASIWDLNGLGRITSSEVGELVSYVDNVNDNIGSTTDLYDRLNVEGLPEAHSEGWTGAGVNIGIFDTGIHGIEVSDTAEAVAPGANVLYLNDSSSSAFSGMDITNHSYGWSPSYKYKAISHFNEVDLTNPDALHVMAAPNTNTCTDIGASTTGGIEFCDGNAVAFLEGSLIGDYIIVGAHGEGYNSPSVGTEVVLQDSFIVADGFGLGDSPGTSFAAPKVAGAAALVMHKFTNIDAQDTKSILLNTANDNFTGYHVEVHGQGKLDVGAALSPVGNLH